MVRLAACAASGATFLALTGCGGGLPEDSYASPPPAAYDRGDAYAPGLMGEAPAPRGDGTGLAGGPKDYVGMRPIPNPEDLTRAERVRYYGHRYDHLPEPRRARAAAGQPRHALITRRRADGTLEVSMRPIANPEDMSPAERRRVYGARYAPRPEAKITPRRAAPPPEIVAAPAKPVAAAPTPAPKAGAPAPAKPVAAPRPPPAEQLSAAVKPEAVPTVETAKEKAGGVRMPKLALSSLAIPGMKPVDVPGVGKVASEKLVGAALALVALLLVLAMARNASASRARAERRRRFRTMHDLGAEPAHETVSQPYVNPMLAAAGGAAVAHGAHEAQAVAQQPEPAHGDEPEHATEAQGDGEPHAAPAEVRQDAQGHDSQADHRQLEDA